MFAGEWPEKQKWRTTKRKSLLPQPTIKFKGSCQSTPYASIPTDAI